MTTSPSTVGTVIVYGPFFARTGFGVLARGTAMGLHRAGVKVRIVPVDCDDQNAAGDQDDVDLYLLQSLRYTPITGPVTAIFAYVPTYLWPKLTFPEPCQRIMLTTFDSSANAATPPFRLVYICNQMDQVWVANLAEKEAWIRGGIDPARIHYFNWAHEWIDNPLLGPPVPRMRPAGTPFRFLHISLFLPRRRLDVLVRAFFEEFREAKEAELILKMSYPSWHPLPGKPKADLRELIDTLRRETGSQAPVIVDETLGTRKDLARLIDSCDGYVSADTTVTAPVTEAIVRDRPVIITDGWGVDLPPEAIVVPNGTDRVAVTPAMAEYMPHQKGASFAALSVTEMRRALRRLANLSTDALRDITSRTSQYMRDRYSYAATVPVMLNLIEQGMARRIRVLDAGLKPASARNAKALHIQWGGLQLFQGKIPKFNREVAHELIARGHELSLSPANGPFHIEEIELASCAKYRELARHFHAPLAGPADINVCYRWHPIFKEQPAKRQILGSTWWSGTIPQEWVRPLAENVDEVWVPSGFVRDNFIHSGVDPSRVQVIPMGVDPTVFKPGGPPYTLKTRKSFKFLFVGETSPRRGLDALLAAYAQSFTRRDDVCLVIKDMDCEDYYGRLVNRNLIAKFMADPRCPEIEYIATMLPEPDLAALYGSCDCLVQPHRTASANLAALEAMACGLPVITTDFGGVREFVATDNAYLLPAKIVRRRPANVGHWRVTGDQLHAEIKVQDVADRLRHVFTHGAEARALGARAGETVRERFTWKKTADLVIARMTAVLAAPEAQALPAPKVAKPAGVATVTDGPTIVIYAPFYNRSGYGVAARCLAAAWHAAGLRIRIVPVDNVEKGVDDCDLELLRSLEKTPVTTPVIAVFFHVASAGWLKIPLPPQSARILFTTFDGTAQGLKPPAEWVSVCNQMDQLWLQTDKERSVFAAAGVAKDKIQVLRCPHPWINNYSLPAAEPKADAGKFRFLSIAMFQPRRRWDTLIESFLTEFKNTDSVELYLKVNYPSWHPVPGRPAQDLRKLIETLREKTGSAASIILDDDLGTRLGICKLIDACDVCVSTDTTITAPVGEAFVRGKIAVIPDGYCVSLPYCESTLVIPVDPKLTGPMSEEMLQYQPHHRGRAMPLLRVEDVSRTLRAAFELPAEKRWEMGRQGALVMECSYGPAVTTPPFLKAISKALKDKFSNAQSGVVLNWEGSFLDHGSLSHVNRELVGALKNGAVAQVRCVTNGAPIAADAAKVWPLLFREVATSPAPDPAITVRHAWPPNWKRPAQGKLVVIQPWEFGSLPKQWVAWSSAVDEFWLPSEYVRRVYVDSGVPAEKVFVVPNGVDPEKFHPEAAPMSLATQKKFKFLFVGGTIGRKGVDLLLQAYLGRFTKTDDVCLVIKDFGGKSAYKGQTMESQIRGFQAQPNAPEILYLNEELPPESLPGLYTACQCLILPYRGEGFGLPVLEAMACGLPVIVTAGGATDDFVRDEFAYQIPAQIRKLAGEVSGMKLVDTGWMLEPDLAQLGGQMRAVFGDPAAAQARGQLASRHAHQFYSWKNSAAAIQQRIAKLMEVRTAPIPPPTAPQVVPTVAQVGRLNEARELLADQKLEAAWQAANTAISQRPFHPAAFLLLAEIALAAGDGAAARKCAQHARNLAPAWEPAKLFLKQSLKAGTPPKWLTAPVQVQKTAPANRLSVCLIVKNEEKFIAQCLKSVRDIASQIVVVDTGSQDRTVEIAREFGAEISSFAWSDDFAAARNAALQAATGDWILMVDADEEIPAAQHPKLIADMKNLAVLGYRLPLINVGQEAEGCSYVPRLFRNAPGIFYSGRIHEQLFPSLLPLCKLWGVRTALGAPELLHHGYTPEMVRDRNKVERNLKLLQRAVVENPGDVNLVMNLGLEVVRSGDVNAGLVHYRKAFEMMSAQPAAQVVPELREVLLTQFTSQLYKIQGHAEVVRVLSSPLAANGGLTSSLHLTLGLSFFELNDYKLAAENMGQCLAKRNKTCLSPINVDIHGAAPNHCLALCLARLNDAAGAEKSFQAAVAATGSVDAAKLDYAKFLSDAGRPVEALQKLNEIVAVNVKHARAWKAGGEIALSRAEFAEFACDWTGEAVRALPEDSALVAQRAEALMLHGEAAEAAKVWQRLEASHPDIRQQAALILCELSADVPVHKLDADADELAVTRSFIEWYQKLIRARANAVVEGVNARLEKLSHVLPTAAHMIEAALGQADNCVPA